MIRPDEIDIMSFFESEPTYMDDHLIIPYDYNFASYVYHAVNQNVMFSICPASSEVAITIEYDANSSVDFKLNNVNQITILSDSKNSAEMDIVSDFSSTLLTLKPNICIKHFEARNV